jgi:hypothetical protein
MLVKSQKLKHTVDANYLKKQLYSHRQNMDHSVYEACANLVNSLRTIIQTSSSTEVKYQGSIITYIQIRKLRKFLVDYAQQNQVPYIKHSLIKMTLESDINSTQALDVQHKSLYFMTHKKYDMFVTDGIDNSKKNLTSMSSITSDLTKASFLGNFFNTKYLQYRFQRRNLQPIWRFTFTDKYNISFLGKKNQL